METHLNKTVQFARESGLISEYLKAFEALVRADEREQALAQPAPELVAAMAQTLGDRLAKEQAVYLSMETAKSLVKSMLATPPAQS